MRRKIAIFIIMMLLLTFVFPFSEVKAESNKIKDLLSTMTTEQKIAQMLMPEFRTYIDSESNKKNVTTLTASIKNIVKQYGFSGVILFAENNISTEQTVKLIDEFQTANDGEENRPQLLIAVDQEGAIVSRLSHGTQMPGNMALGATGNEKNVYDAGKIIGSELAKIGYNVDFAPVVDINNNPANPVIGVRSFSDDANTVAKFSVQFMKGIQSENVLTSLKHFPGHGDTATDSHTGLPRINKTYNELKQNELIPFKECINAGTDIIMTTHIQYPQIEKETYTSIKDGEKIELPATLSKTIITDILRGDLGYNGVVVTDAMYMSAISENFNKLDSARLAISAGVDIILMPIDTGAKDGIQNLEQYIKDIAKMVEADSNLKDNVDKAVTRILTLKEKNGLLEKYDNSNLQNKINEATSFVGSKANHDKEWEITEKSITLVKNDSNMLPIVNNEKTVVMVAYANEVLSAEYAIDRLKAEGKIANDMDITVYLFKDKTVEEMQNVVKNVKNVIVISEAYSEKGLAGDTYKNMDKLIEYVHSNGNKIAFISCALPYDVARLQEADSILVAWSYKGMNEKPDFSKETVKTYGVSIPVGIYMAFGKDTKISGKLPINIPSLNSEYKYTNTYLYNRGYGLEYALNGEVNVEETQKIDENKQNENVNKIIENDNTKTDTSNTKNPKSGDNVYMYLGIAILAVICVAFIYYKVKKK